MNRRRLGSIIAAVLLALLGTFIILVYVTSADERARAGAELTRVLVAAEPVEAGVPAAELEGRVREEQMLAGSAEQVAAVRQLTDLGDQETRVQILEGQQIIQAQFGPPGEASASGTGGDIPEGLEVLSVILTREQAVGGRIDEGSRVGVLMSIDAVDPEDSDEGDAGETQARTAMALNNIRVVRVAGGALSEDGTDEGLGGGDSVTVWLAVTPADAERIVFAQTNGSIWLTDQGEGNPRPPDQDLRDEQNIFEGIDANVPTPDDAADADSGQGGDA